MSRRDYEAIAIILRSESSPEVTRLCERFANLFQHDNSRFDRARFLRACGELWPDNEVTP